MAPCGLRHLWQLEVLTVAAVLIAAGVHRVGGMGFALVAMPVLIMLHGPKDGMCLGLLLGLMISVAALAQTWRSVDLRITALLALPAVGTIPLGALVAHTVSSSILLMILGTLLVSLLLTGQMIRQREKQNNRWSLPLGTGLLAGFIHGLSGLSAPLLTAYAISSRWHHQIFVASSQVVFIVFNMASLLTWGWSGTLLVQSAILSPVLLLGVCAGACVRRLIRPGMAMRITLTVAWASALGAIAKGVLGWP